MTDQIKNRVVGTIVIFALAIIFLPGILDGKKQQLRDDFKTIPVKPQYQTPQLAQIIQPDSPPAQPAASTKTKVDTQPSVTVKPKPVTVKKLVTVSAKTSPAKVKPAWVITVGSFKDPKNVRALLTKLRKNGFTAFSIPHTPQVNQTSKVFVGPALNKSTLIKLQPKLKSLINESGFISAYNPTEK